MPATKTPIFSMVFGKGERRCTCRTSSENLTKNAEIAAFWQGSFYSCLAYYQNIIYYSKNGFQSLIFYIQPVLKAIKKRRKAASRKTSFAGRRPIYDSLNYCLFRTPPENSAKKSVQETPSGKLRPENSVRKIIEVPDVSLYTR